MPYELVYPGLCLAEAAQRLVRRRRLARGTFSYRAVRGRPLAARLALHRFEAALPRPDETAARSRRRSGRAQRRDGVDGALVERQFGNGHVTLVQLLHGWNAQSAIMWPLTQALAAQVPWVTVPDLPGEGDHPAAVLSFSAKARILAQSYHPPPLDIVAKHSIGGLIAPQPIEHALCARHLVTISAPLSMATLLQTYLQRIDAPLGQLDALLALYERCEGQSAHLTGPPVYTVDNNRLLMVHARAEWQVRVQEVEAIAALSGVAPMVLDGGNNHSIIADSRLYACLAGLLPKKELASARQIRC